MFDQMTRPLQQVTQALNLTITAMDSLSNSANRDIKITNSLNAAKSAISRANSGLNELASSQNNAANEQNKLNNTFNRGKSESDGLLSKIKSLAATYLGLRVAREVLDDTVGGAMRAQQQLFTLQGIMGDKDVGAAYFENLREQANKSTFAFEEFAGNARKYMQFTKNTDSLDKLANLSERLTLMDPTQGLEGAGFALKEAMSGDFVSLKERFGFGKADAEILKASKSMDEFITKFDNLLSKKGFTEDMLEQYNKSAAAQFNNLKSNFKTSLSNAGQGALEALMPLITGLNQAFNSGTFQPMLDVLASGLRVISVIIVDVANGVAWLGEIAMNNWGIIEPILISIAIYFIALIIPALWETITTLAAMAVAWLMVNWPVLLIIGAIALLIYILNLCGVTAGQVVGFIGGIFGFLWAHLYNGIAFIWNHFASLAEFLANVFNHPLYATKKLFANIWNNIVKFVANALQSMVDMAKAVPFLSDFIGDVNITGANLQIDVGEAPADYWEAPRMEFKNYAEEASAGYNKGESFANAVGDKFADVSSMFKPGSDVDLDAWNASKGPGELAMAGDKSKGKGKGSGKNLKDANKHLKNIDDKIDISNENLEVMRDLAEMESIQNFVSLTPTVQVTTGDIKEEADINSIISKIETYMENELVNSAEGVYI